VPDYNFLNLSPPEFEDLSKDLLQKHLKLTLESFTSGRDKGIDLRYAGKGKSDLIVQCKRYGEYNSLLTNLKKEISKVHSLKPKRYILTTSVGLTPNQKDEISKLFNPYLLSTVDIYGRQDLNNLLGLFLEIEKQHFKLWLSSTNILEKILHSRILNQSNFEEQKIKETIKVYVENESYFQALKILKEKKYVIISGIPGIGKTTLARILVYQFLASGFEEFVFLSDSIKEAYDTFKGGVKQIFFFDDFLGRNFLERKLSNNEEQRIVKFIEKVGESKDKLIILTTREYILTQAKQRYDIFDNPSLEFAKCVIDLSQYTKIVRAKILYNHLFFSDITEKYIVNILEKENYKKIIQHRNYNPRIIETITNHDIWKDIKPEGFSDRILEFLDYPESIWKHVYENQISRFSQCVLANLMSAGTPILLDDLRTLIQNFAKTNTTKYSIAYSELEFKKSIHELENTFIITRKDQINQIAVDYQNPSVQDFLVNYFQELPDFISDIIQSAIYFNQLFSVFAIEDNYLINAKLVKWTNKIILKGELKKLLINKLLTDYDFLNSSTLHSVYNITTVSTTQWRRQNSSDYFKLNEIIKEFQLYEYPKIRSFVSKIFRRVVIPYDLDSNDFIDYIYLLREFKNDYTFDKSELISKYFNCISFLQQTMDFELLGEEYPDEFQDFIENSDKFKDRVSDLMYEEAENAEYDYLQSALEDIESVSNRFGIDCDDARGIIEVKIKMKKEEEEARQDYDWDDDFEGERPTTKAIDENEKIKNIFDSLRDK